MEKRDVKGRLSEAVNVPKDVTLGLPYLSIMGNEEAYVENYRGILEYRNELIRIQTKLGKIHISGHDLQIEYYSNDEMKITGFLTRIEYQVGGNNC